MPSDLCQIIFGNNFKGMNQWWLCSDWGYAAQITVKYIKNDSASKHIYLDKYHTCCSVISISMHNTKPEGIAGIHADNSLGNTGKQCFYAKAWKSTIIWYYEISKHIFELNQHNLCKLEDSFLMFLAGSFRLRNSKKIFGRCAP